MVRVANLEESIEWYTSNFDYEEVSRWEADTFTNAKLAPPGRPSSAATIELTYNHDGRSYEMGDAWGHIALRVEDVYEVYEQLMDSGVEDYRDPDSCGGNIAFVKDPDGHEIELVTSSTGTEFAVDHVMTRVEDATEALGYWIRTFEFVESHRWEADTFANYFVEPEDAATDEMKLELTYNYDGRSYTMGDAWGHLAVRVDDLESAWEAVVERESAPFRDPASNDGKYAFTTDQDGHEIEIL